MGTRSASIGQQSLGSPRVSDQASGAEQEEGRHQHGAGDAPLADRFDPEQLDVGEVDAEAEAAEGDEKASEPGRVTGEEGAEEQQDVAEDAEDGDVDPGQMRVGAFGDGLAPRAAGEAGRRPAAGVGDRDLGRDADPESGEEGDRPAQVCLVGKAHRGEDRALP
jgi:hypothetical protein